MKFVEYKNRYGHKVILAEELVPKFEIMQEILTAMGMGLEITDGWRGEVDQEKAKAGGFSNAHFGLSPHGYGVAFDCAPVINGVLCWPKADDPVWETIARTGEAQGLVWGGHFSKNPDDPHFELANWRAMGLTLYHEAPPIGV